MPAAPRSRAGMAGRSLVAENGCPTRVAGLLSFMKDHVTLKADEGHTCNCKCCSWDFPPSPDTFLTDCNHSEPLRAGSQQPSTRLVP